MKSFKPLLQGFRVEYYRSLCGLTSQGAEVKDAGDGKRFALADEPKEPEPAARYCSLGFAPSRTRSSAAQTLNPKP